MRTRVPNGARSGLPLLLLALGAATLGVGCSDSARSGSGSGAGAGAGSGSDTGAGQVNATLTVAEAMGGTDTTGFARAFEPRDFVFPADHGPHPDFRTEWWYFTGHLDEVVDGPEPGPEPGSEPGAGVGQAAGAAPGAAAKSGRRFGFQYTIFRSALLPEPVESPNPWATRQMYMGHFTVTDVERGRFSEFERFTRGGAGLAGARAGGEQPFAVWLDDWRISGPEDPSRSWPMTVQAADSGVALSIRVEPVKDLVLQGDRGLSQKGPEPGNASYYYSYTRLQAEGHVVIEGDTIAVRGESWLDREWSTSALSEGQVGWDWFSLQLSDGTELMVYDLRQADGTPSAESEGVWVGTDGAVTRLAGADYTLTPTDVWSSPLDGAQYPSGWRIEVPQLELDLAVEPVLRDQPPPGPGSCCRTGAAAT